MSVSPCAACKLQRRKCQQQCIFAPYFPADTPQKFANIHKVFGASNVSKLLSEMGAHQRQDAVDSLSYEAEYRLQEPIFGCVGLISVLKQKLNQCVMDLENAKKELATYVIPSSLLPLFHQASGYGPTHVNNLPPSSAIAAPYRPTIFGQMHGTVNEIPFAIRELQASIGATDTEEMEPPPPETVMRNYEYSSDLI